MQKKHNREADTDCFFYLWGMLISR